MAISTGTIGPDFILPDQQGNPFHLADARGKAAVMILALPQCFTPICSTELPALEATLDQFLAAGVWPVALTVDGTAPNLAWTRQLGVRRVRLLSDANPQGRVSRMYGILAPDNVAERSTIILDKNGVVRYAVVAGRYGKRSIPGLLAIASQISGGHLVPAQAAAAGLMQLDLPIVYTMNGCSHCEKVKSFLASSGLSQKVVVKDTSDQTAMRELLAIRPDGSVPVMRLPNGHIVAGDRPIISALQTAVAA